MRRWWNILAMGSVFIQKIAWANVVNAGGSRIPIVTQAIDLHQVIGGVGIPLVCLICLFGVLFCIAFGIMRISTGMGRVLFVVFLGAFGISGIATMFGLDEAIAVVG